MDRLLPLAAAVLKSCQSRGLMLATAESCTGGLVSAALTAVPGSSATVERGFVTYANAAKTEMLGVPIELITLHGAVSEPVARAMALGALDATPRADLTVSITGVAGPGGTPTKPEGMVCFACATRWGRITVLTRQFGPQGRAEVRLLAAEQALALLKDAAEVYE